MGRLDLRDKWRDEDTEGLVDSPPTSEVLRADEHSLTRPHQMDVWDCIADAEKDAA